ncbi:hypothetical protein ACKWRH_23745 [Bradyrhizobium sp. Pa8]|uniref:hypothetical protein n=1 Tax=Bradyrhizobium sp. Pa8 TaxID=3386552 RepID=UPI00403F9934
MFDPDYKRIELATYIVCMLPRDVAEATAVLSLASQLAPTILTSEEARLNELRKLEGRAAS